MSGAAARTGGEMKKCKNKQQRKVVKRGILNKTISLDMD